MTLVSQLITDARTRFGADNVEAVAVEPSLLDQTMEHVVALGGDVSPDVCVVDGVAVRELEPGATTPMVHLRDTDEPQPLLPESDDEGESA